MLSKLRKITCILIIIFLFTQPILAQSSATIIVDPNTRYQTITGWEAGEQAGQDFPGFPQFSDTLFTQAVNDLGISRFRLAIRSGLEHTQDNYTIWKGKGSPTSGVEYDTWRCIRTSTVNDNSDPNSINWNGFHFAELDNSIQKVVLPMKQKLEARGEKLYINWRKPRWESIENKRNGS